MAADSTYLNSSAATSEPSSPEATNTTSENGFVASSTASNEAFQLSITTQPPLKTVYQRILKPFPTVTLTVVAPQAKAKHSNKGRRRSQAPISDDEEVASAAENTSSPTQLDASYADVLETLLANTTNNASSGLFAEVNLLRGDNGEPISKCLDGNSIVRFEKNPWSEGVYTATFKKLKILATSQQLQGILFRLQFTLRKYVGNTFTTITLPACTVVSNPVEVFSHSQYLNKTPKSANTGPRKDFKDIVKKMDSKKMPGAVLTVLQAYKDQGGNRASVLEMVQRVFGDDSKARGVPRRMSTPSPNFAGNQQTAAASTIGSDVSTTTSNAPSGGAVSMATAMEVQFLSDLLGKLLIGALTRDEFVNQLTHAVGKARAAPLLAQMGFPADGSVPASGASSQPLSLPMASAPSLAPSPSPVTLPSPPAATVPQTLASLSAATTAPMDSSLAVIINALAHQQAQLAQLQNQQLGIVSTPFLQQQVQQQLQQQLLQQLQHQQLAAAAASLPVMPKPRRVSNPSLSTAMSPSSSSSPQTQALPTASALSAAALAPASSASSSLSTLADAITSHLQQQQPVLPPASSFVDLASSPLPASGAGTSLSPINPTLGTATSSATLPALFSLSSLASVIDTSEAGRGRKRSLEIMDTPIAAPHSPQKVARRSEADADAPSTSSLESSSFSSLSTSSSSLAVSPAEEAAEDKVQWYWKNNTSWEPFAEGVSAQLERAHKTQAPCVVVLHDVPYRMDFQTMTQQRMDNPKRWKHIRRGEN